MNDALGSPPSLREAALTVNEPELVILFVHVLGTHPGVAPLEIIYDIILIGDEGGMLVTVSERLKQARRRMGWRQADLARGAKVGIATIRRIEQKTMEPRLSTARRIAEALGVRVEWLLFGVGAIGDKHADEERIP